MAANIIKLKQYQILTNRWDREEQDGEYPDVDAEVVARSVWRTEAVGATWPPQLQSEDDGQDNPQHERQEGVHEQAHALDRVRRKLKRPGLDIAFEIDAEADAEFAVDEVILISRMLHINKKDFFVERVRYISLQKMKKK